MWEASVVLHGPHFSRLSISTSHRIISQKFLPKIVLVVHYLISYGLYTTYSVAPAFPTHHPYFFLPLYTLVFLWSIGRHIFILGEGWNFPLPHSIAGLRVVLVWLVFS